MEALQICRASSIPHTSACFNRIVIMLDIHTMLGPADLNNIMVIYQNQSVFLLKEKAQSEPESECNMTGSS